MNIPGFRLDPSKGRNKGRWAIWVDGTWQLTFEFREGDACLQDDEEYHSHPGEFIAQIYLAPNGLSGRELALKLGVAASTLSRILKGSSGISPEMALRLSKVLGRSPGTWLSMQYNYDLWRAKRRVDLGNLSEFRPTDSETS